MYNVPQCCIFICQLSLSVTWYMQYCSVYSIYIFNNLLSCFEVLHMIKMRLCVVTVLKNNMTLIVCVDIKIMKTPNKFEDLMHLTWNKFVQVPISLRYKIVSQLIWKCTEELLQKILILWYINIVLMWQWTIPLTIAVKRQYM